VLGSSEEKILVQQWQEFNRVKELLISRNPLLEMAEAGKPELRQGTLLHGTAYSPETMKAIKATGIFPFGAGLLLLLAICLTNVRF
jgi:hypothetical protein